MSQAPIVIDFESVEGETPEQTVQRIDQMIRTKLQAQGIDTSNIEHFYPTAISEVSALPAQGEKATITMEFEAVSYGQNERDLAQGWSWSVPHPSLMNHNTPR